MVFCHAESFRPVNECGFSETPGKVKKWFIAEAFWGVSTLKGLGGDNQNF
jgi:hypothetical protein